MNEIFELIKKNFDEKNRDAKRLFHGRSKQIPNFDFINVDWFYPSIIITLFKSVPDACLMKLIDDIEGIVDCENIFIEERFNKNLWRVWKGSISRKNIALEKDMKFILRIGDRQNVGLFLDMRHARTYIRDNSRDKKILNLFAYTCSFSVAAMKGGASKVTNIDMSSSFLSWGRDNHRLNDIDTQNVKFFAYDILRSFGGMERMGLYDLIIVDPPSFQKGSFEIKKDYSKIVRRLNRLLAKDGKVLLAMNDPTLLRSFLLDLVKKEAPFLELEQYILTPDELLQISENGALWVGIFKFSK